MNYIILNSIYVPQMQDCCIDNEKIQITTIYLFIYLALPTICYMIALSETSYFINCGETDVTHESFK
jgi:hypothetical protein